MFVLNFYTYNLHHDLKKIDDVITPKKKTLYYKLVRSYHQPTFYTTKGAYIYFDSTGGYKVGPLLVVNGVMGPL